MSFEVAIDGDDEYRTIDIHDIDMSQLKPPGDLSEEHGLVQDPIGGTVRPDQLGTIVIRDLEHCLDLAQGGLFNFSSILKNVLLRIEAIKSNEDE